MRSARYSDSDEMEQGDYAHSFGSMEKPPKMGWDTLSAPAYKGPVTDHFDGERFHNPSAPVDRSFGDVLRFLIRRKRGDWARTPSGSANSFSPPLRVRDDDLRITFVDHSTVLIQTAGVNIVTDPVWADRVSPVSWAGPKRAHPPGLQLQALPPIDVILLSHNHYDHCDLESIKVLVRRFDPVILTPLGNTALLKARGIGQGSHDLDWWQTADVAGGLEITCVPARHWSGRGLLDRAKNLWGGFVIRRPSSPTAGPIYFAGDTGDGPHFEEIRDRFGAPRIALLPIGAYLPQWFMQPVHLSPQEAVAVRARLGAPVAMAIHFGAFELADDGQRQPIDDLVRARKDAGISPEQFWLPTPGDSRLYEAHPHGGE